MRTKIRSREAAKAAVEEAIRLLKDSSTYFTNAGHFERIERLSPRVKHAADRLRILSATLPQ
jgi:hypothetical protein